MAKILLISEISITFRSVPNTNPARYDMVTTTNSEAFQINNIKLYVVLLLFQLMIISIF